MKHQYGIAHLQVLELGPVEMTELAAWCGYDFVGFRLTRVTAEEPHYPIITDRSLLCATKARLNDTGVRCIDVEVVRLLPEVEPETYQNFLETGAELGARSVTVHLPDPKVARAIDKFGRLCAMAKPLGLHVAIEFLPWTEMASLSDAAHVCRSVGADNCGILIDTLHFHRSLSTIAELKALRPEWVQMIHIADCPAPTPTEVTALIHTARRERLLPGEGAIDFSDILAALTSRPPLMLEIPHEQRVKDMGIFDYSRHALEVSKKRLDAI